MAWPDITPLLSQNVHCAIARVEDMAGNVLINAAAGQERSEGTVAHPDSRFHIASVTKTMTATLVLQAYEAGDLDIEAPIASLGVFSKEVVDRLHAPGMAEKITPRHLLSHTSGLRDAVVDTPSETGTAGAGSLVGHLMSGGGNDSGFWEPWDPDKPDDLNVGVLNYFINSGLSAAPLFTPGDAFHYSDTGYVILGLILEVVNGKSLHSLYREQIFKPLGMDASYLAYRDDPAGMDSQRAGECEVWMGDIPSLQSGFSLSFDWAGGGIVSTSADLAKFLRGLLSDDLFHTKASISRMTEWQTPQGLEAPRTGVGLGLFKSRYGDRELVGHAGHWSVQMQADLDAGLIITGTLNQSQDRNAWHVDLLNSIAIEKA